MRTTLTVDCDLCVSELRDPLEIIDSPRADLPKEDLLGCAPAQDSTHTVHKLLLGH